MIKWIRPCGAPITTNDTERDIEAAEYLGWVRDDGNSSASSESKPAKNTRSSKRKPARSKRV